jgi:hypothetical protein
MSEVVWIHQVFREDVDADKMVKTHIKLLHQYNEAKDAAQVFVHLQRFRHTSSAHDLNSCL